MRPFKPTWANYPRASRFDPRVTLANRQRSGAATRSLRVVDARNTRSNVYIVSRGDWDAQQKRKIRKSARILKVRVRCSRSPIRRNVRRSRESRPRRSAIVAQIQRRVHGFGWAAMLKRHPMKIVLRHLRRLNAQKANQVFDSNPPSSK
jgi:hypothetical protein